jgi:glycosyltransferase involved in cell wall biosynthesis
MAAGRPVVATDIGGAREAVLEGETGFIVPPKDAEIMAARIVDLLREPERARAMGARGRLVVEQRFSMEAQFRATLEVYEKLLGPHSFTQMRKSKGISEGITQGDSPG